MNGTEPSSVGARRATAIAHLDRLIARGRQIEERAAGAPGSSDDTRRWQQECAAAVSELAGGSKAHWLSREFSAALLVRSADGAAVVEADTAAIVRRLLDVLAQARLSLQLSFEGADASAGAAPRRFEFVHRTALRPVLERAFADGRDALERGEFERALVLSSGVIEAIITDALEHALAARRGRGDEAPPADAVASWTFDERIAEAQRLGLIRNGCARLPAVARRCRESIDAGGAPGGGQVVSERDARLTSQVLHVVIRDLDPGR